MFTDISKNSKENAANTEEFFVNVNDILAGFVELDSSFKVKKFNGNARRFYQNYFNCTIEEGTNLYETILQSSNHSAVEEILSVIDSGERGGFEMECIRKCSQHKWFHFDVNPKFGKRKMINGIVILSLDVSDFFEAKAQLEKDQQRNVLVSKATNDIIWDWDIVNDEMYRTQNQNESFITNESGASTEYTWLSNMHPDDLERVRKSVSEALYKKKAEYWEAEYRYRNAGKKYKYVYDKGYIIYNDAGDPIRMVGAMRDITQHKKNLKSLEKKNTALQEFAYILSHNTRAPLVNIMSCVELLRHHKDELTPEFWQLLQAMEKSANNLDKTIKELNAICDITVDHGKKNYMMRLSELVSNFNIRKFLSRKQSGTRQDKIVKALT